MTHEEETVKFTADIEKDLYDRFREACGPTPMTRVTRMLWENYVKAYEAQQSEENNGHIAAGHS